MRKYQYLLFTVECKFLFSRICVNMDDNFFQIPAISIFFSIMADNNLLYVDKINSLQFKYINLQIIPNTLLRIVFNVILQNIKKTTNFKNKLQPSLLNWVQLMKGVNIVMFSIWNTMCLVQLQVFFFNYR